MAPDLLFDADGTTIVGEVLFDGELFGTYHDRATKRSYVVARFDDLDSKDYAWALNELRTAFEAAEAGPSRRA